MEWIIEYLPLIVCIALLIFFTIRSSKALRHSEGRQQIGMSRMDHSLKMQAEGHELAKAQHEMSKQVLVELVEIKRHLAEIKKSLDQKEK